LFLGIGAANRGTITFAALQHLTDLPGTYALNPCHVIGMLSVGFTQYLAFVWPCGAHQSLKVHTGYHILPFPISVLIGNLRLKRLKSGRQQYGSDLYLYPFLDLGEIDGFVLANGGTDVALLLFKKKAAFVNICYQWNRLRVVYMNRFVIGYRLIECIRVLHGAIFYAGGATCTFVLDDVPGLLGQSDHEVTRLSLYPFNLGIGEYLDVFLPVNLDQFRREYSHGAVIGGEGLIQLSHMPANGR
jgi:hypothetical protein